MAPAIVYKGNLFTKKSLWEQHSVFYSVCWLFAVLKIFVTFHFYYLF